MKLTKFLVGDLIYIHKKCAMLPSQFFYDPNYFRTTIRPYNWIIVNPGTFAVILKTNEIFYDVLLVSEDLGAKSLVIFLDALEKCASK